MTASINREAGRTRSIAREMLAKLACPITLSPLKLSDDSLVAINGENQYRLSASGIPLFAEHGCSLDAARQRDHYQKIADKYFENLGYPHTQEYMAYLDREFVARIDRDDMAETAEICCGQGELLELEGICVGLGIGVDISPKMLEAAQKRHAGRANFLFIQGDATQLPIASEQFKSVFMFGGIHHVSDRQRLFQEVFRILRPGGRFYFREPVSDFFLWRWIRAVVYRLSPALDNETERPLLWRETVPVLEHVGFKLKSWNTYGFLGFCLFMNSDVLIFNRLFRFVPGIRSLTRLSTRIDHLTCRLPGLRRAGLQVVGVAEKPVRI
jgi:SAM-dependent methyltransferase